MTTPLPKEDELLTSSIVQVFAVSDAHAQELIVGLLSGIADMTVRAASNGPELLVTTTCVDDVQATSIFRLVTSIDFNARLLHATNQPTSSLVA
ncbi:MAG TPA: hypothetical protein VMZ66_00405 [Aeromicrobium sp.]|nr:hypothetical protein [Aeromicrobium sp.]